MNDNTLSITYQAGAVDPILRRMQAFCKTINATEAFCFQSRVVVAEALNNIIKHSPENASDGFIRVNFCVTARHLVISLVYWSPEFGLPGEQPCVESTAPSGRGWHIIQQYMDEIYYNHWMGMNTLILKKRLPRCDERRAL